MMTFRKRCVGARTRARMRDAFARRVVRNVRRLFRLCTSLVSLGDRISPLIDGVCVPPPKQTEKEIEKRRGTERRELEGHRKGRQGGGKRRVGRLRVGRQGGESEKRETEKRESQKRGAEGSSPDPLKCTCSKVGPMGIGAASWTISKSVTVGRFPRNQPSGWPKA